MIVEKIFFLVLLEFEYIMVITKHPKFYSQFNLLYKIFSYFIQVSKIVIVTEKKIVEEFIQ